jgi:hypothetical protein
MDNFEEISFGIGKLGFTSIGADAGFVVLAVEEGGQADLLGLCPNDIIVAVDGISIGKCLVDHMNNEEFGLYIGSIPRPLSLMVKVASPRRTEQSPILAGTPSLSVDLNGGNMGPQEAHNFSRELIDMPRYHALQKLDFGGNPVGDAGAAAFALALAKHQALSIVLMSGCRIGCRGALCIASALRSNCHLLCLNLSFNSLGDQGVVGLAEALRSNEESSLVSLSLCKTGMTGKGASAISEVLASGGVDEGVGVGDGVTASTALSGCIGMDNAVSIDTTRMLHDESLTHIDLSWNTIGAEGAAAIAGSLGNNSSLTALDMSGVPANNSSSGGGGGGGGGGVGDDSGGAQSDAENEASPRGGWNNASRSENSRGENSRVLGSKVDQLLGTGDMLVPLPITPPRRMSHQGYDAQMDQGYDAQMDSPQTTYLAESARRRGGGGGSLGGRSSCVEDVDVNGVMFATTLVDALESNHHLTQLSLAKGTLGTEGFQIFVGALAGPPCPSSPVRRLSRPSTSLPSPFRASCSVLAGE